MKRKKRKLHSTPTINDQDAAWQVRHVGSTGRHSSAGLLSCNKHYTQSSIPRHPCEVRVDGLMSNTYYTTADPPTQHVRVRMPQHHQKRFLSQKTKAVEASTDYSGRITKGVSVSLQATRPEAPATVYTHETKRSGTTVPRTIRTHTTPAQLTRVIPGEQAHARLAII